MPCHYNSPSGRPWVNVMTNSGFCMVLPFNALIFVPEMSSACSMSAFVPGSLGLNYLSCRDFACKAREYIQFISIYIVNEDMCNSSFLEGLNNLVVPSAFLYHKFLVQSTIVHHLVLFLHITQGQNVHNSNHTVP